jgi:biopolymer transport protein ExbD
MSSLTVQNPRRRKAVPAINITPLVDVLLILVVVLMLAMPLFVKRLPVELPKTSLSGTPTPTNALKVSIKADGTIFDGEAVSSFASLTRKITPTTTIELSVDKSVTYDVMAQAIGKMQEHDPKEFVLLTN